MIYDIPGIRFQMQATPIWCWAAVSWMVLDYYTHGAGALQCAIASRVTGGNCCPASSFSAGDACNSGVHLEDALATIGHFGGTLAQPQPFEVIKNEILVRRPICAQIALAGVNHCAVISTCSDDQAVRVLDPLGWYDTDFASFTRFNPSNPRGFYTAWFLTR